MLPYPPSLCPDLLVTASGTPIPCNRAALCSASAYFSAQLQDTAPGVLPALDLPSVPPDMFTKLLACTYTGKLDCSTESVYQLFWYAQLLQMPAAVLQCSQFLAQLAGGQETSSPPQTRVVKPIPSRGVPLLPTNPEQLTAPSSFLRPHLASFYSDWFLRYTSLTRESRREEEATTSLATTSHREDQENRGLVEQQQQPSTSAMFTQTGGSLLDTASCDGPVKFHRILNKCFSVELPKQQTPAQLQKDEEIEVTKEDESDESNDTGETYSCVYCNHVFKSHYCYQKHKRRHINPVTVDIQGSDQDKKSLVMKDLNVQYFPCKICGAKFPSYYFVHKHKKLWHRAQLELEQELEQQQEQQQKEVVKQEGSGLLASELLRGMKKDFNAK